jgi:hypothetical protein
MSELRVVATLALGLLGGALLTEALVLVPYWRTLPATAFTNLHHGVAPRLYAFFAPLTVVAVVLATVSGLVSAISAPLAWADWFTIGSSLLALSLLGFYRFYFESANRELPELALLADPSKLADELRRWQRVHLVRTVVCVASFAGAALGMAF